MALGLYIHLPFCHSVCAYCDFPKLAQAMEFAPAYVEALIRELGAYAEELPEVRTVYFGGGTPSALGIPLLGRLFDALETRMDKSRWEEVTLEANSDDLDASMAAFLVARGVNRVSVGVQTSHRRLLSILGRPQDPHNVPRAVKRLREAGIDNVNLDFVYAIPTQTIPELQEDLEFAIGLNPTHLSFYSLILEERTPLARAVRSGRWESLSEETEAQMFERVNDFLPRAGYLPYEVSNFSLPGWHSRHNMIYWNVQPYLGLGMGAHSQIGTIRFHNHPTLRAYLEAVEVTGHGRQAQDDCDLSMETGLMTLRLREGIGLTAFYRRFGVDLLARYPRLRYYLEQNLLVVENDHLRLTPRGLLLMNQVETAFWERAC